jgi:SRSO17 transposase
VQVGFDAGFAVAAAWAIDDTGLLKCGIASPCVARQYTGTAGKVTNCQVAVSVRFFETVHVRELIRVFIGP